MPFEILLGLRYTKAKRRNHFISFISLISMLGIALGAHWQECYATKNALWLIGISFDSDAKSDILKETDRSN